MLQQPNHSSVLTQLALVASVVRQEGSRQYLQHGERWQAARDKTEIVFCQHTCSWSRYVNSKLWMLKVLMWLFPTLLCWFHWWLVAGLWYDTNAKDGIEENLPRGFLFLQQPKIHLTAFACKWSGVRKMLLQDCVSWLLKCATWLVAIRTNTEVNWVKILLRGKKQFKKGWFQR